MSPRATHFALPLLLAAAAVCAACAGGDDTEAPGPQPVKLVRIPPAARLVFTANLYAEAASGGREIYACNADGTAVTRLTFCNDNDPCDTLTASPAADRARILATRRADANGDGVFNAGDPLAMLYLDVSRQVQAAFAAEVQGVSGADWTPSADFTAITATGTGNLDDLFLTDGKGTTTDSSIFRNFSSSPTLTERGPRMRADGNAAAFERIADGSPSAIFFASVGLPTAVTAKLPGGELLPGTVYRVGSDADPGFSPDGNSIVFRRLSAVTADGKGQWDILVAVADASGLRTIASGPAFRGAPDWSELGIVFPEADAAGAVSLVLVDPASGKRSVLLSAPAGRTLSNPRWLAAQAQ
jgi:hypothetical protein